MNEDLLLMLKESNDYISGEEISKKFGVTRAAVWKSINALKEKGYKIEGVSRKGYKLIFSPDLFIKKELINSLSTKFIGHNIEYFETVSSTNEVAKDCASKGSADGTLIISEEQNGGRGRFDRPWKSPKGGLWFSLILKPNIEPTAASKITQIVGAALLNALKSLDIKALIKWPNDVYVNGKKICGILTEMKCDMERVNYLVVGIGINVNLDESSFDDSIKDKATSLKVIKGEPIDKTYLLTTFLKEFEDMYLKFVNENDFSTPLSICRDNSFILNKDAYHVTIAGKEKVTCIGINDQGELLVKDSSGNIKPVLSGEITFKLEN